MINLRRARWGKSKEGMVEVTNWEYKYRSETCAVVCINSNIKSKSNVVPVYAMKAYRGVDLQVYLFLVSALDGSERPTALLPRQNPLTHYIGG